MNTLLIILLVMVIIISIFVVFQGFDLSYLIRDSKPLLNPKGQTNIELGLIDMPGSSRYYYEGWFYIHHNAPVYSLNVLFNRGNDFVVGLLGSTLNVYVNTNLNGGKGVNSDGVLDTSGVKPIVSIPDFPFQKWAHIVIFVDGLIVDVYLDGKLIKSVKNTIPINVNPSNPIQYGNKYTVGEITRFKRPAQSINPQGVWNSYMRGSGQGSSSSDYNVYAQLTKNNHILIDKKLV